MINRKDFRSNFRLISCLIEVLLGKMYFERYELMLLHYLCKIIWEESIRLALATAKRWVFFNLFVVTIFELTEIFLTNFSIQYLFVPIFIILEELALWYTALQSCTLWDSLQNKHEALIVSRLFCFWLDFCNEKVIFMRL